MPVTVGDLTATVTKIMPTASTAGMHLKLVDSSTGLTVIDKDYTVQYAPADGLNVSQRDEVQKRMQRDINVYKAKKAVYDTAAMGTAATFIENNLNL